MVLDREYETYRAKLPELLATDAGRYVLVHGDDVIGIFDSNKQAQIAGWERGFHEPFLVEQIGANQNGTILDREMATYRAKLPELLQKDTGRYVLIHRDDVIGIFDTQEQALEEGYERWLFEAFLVKQILAHEPIFRVG